ncbi:hypothetical protein [Demequina sp.]|uniref:hypothetical protein n=1 Tax=Demequina sp. TaxID=2050685 RepID=UPI003A8B4B4E
MDLRPPYPTLPYLEREAGLPHMGASVRGPRALEHEDVDAIMACADAQALAEMKAYARSYFAVSGMIVMSAGGVVAATAARRPALALGAVALGTLAALGVMEARRSARQWEAVIDARLTTLASGSPGEHGSPASGRIGRLH